ncbi:MAG TPA: sulfotransferase [Opitutus sp.]|nr:sulfotransferase [Opitutus sp.]
MTAAAATAMEPVTVRNGADGGVALDGWTPLRLAWREGMPLVDWCRLGDVAFTDPFFEQTIGRALRHPARLLFRRETSMERLEAVAHERPGVKPAGFIFHESRCGSTLVAQMLAAHLDSIVLAEAPPIDQVLRAHRRDGSISRAQRIGWLRAMISALGQTRRGGERRLFVKFDSWHALELPLIVGAFPDVPWVFLYRDPVEVLVSHQRQRGSQMIPGALDLRAFGVSGWGDTQMSLDAYCARVLSVICQAAVNHAALGRGRLVNFSELPQAVWDETSPLFGIEWTPEELERMCGAARRNSKDPSRPHTDDRQEKQREASVELRRLADEWVAPSYAQLEALRLAQAGGTAAAASAESASSRSRSQSFTTQSITR